MQECDKCRWKVICELNTINCKYFDCREETKWENKLIEMPEYISIMETIDLIKEKLTVSEIKEMCRDMAVERKIKWLMNRNNKVKDNKVELTDHQHKFVNILLRETTLVERPNVPIKEVLNQMDNPMIIGAMITTLRKKKVIDLSIEKVNGKYEKLIYLTDVGKQYVEEHRVKV